MKPKKRGIYVKVIAVDDVAINLDVFCAEAENLESVEIMGLFQNPLEALDFVSRTPVDIAVLDIEMPELNGIELGQKLKECCPNIELIYITGSKDYAFDAFQLEASAYLTKPYFPEDIENAVARACRLSGKEEPKTKKPNIFIRTFGRFEIFVDGKPVEFSSSKAKEMLALIVDRKGGIVTTEEMLTYLWEDRPDDDKSRNLCRKVAQRLHRQLEERGIDSILLRHNRGRSLDIGKVTCDYYEYLDGNEERKNEFHGEYMSNYSWAEETLATLL
jgi:two-component SAPR family response regulator